IRTSASIRRCSTSIDAVGGATEGAGWLTGLGDGTGGALGGTEDVTAGAGALVGFTGFAAGAAGLSFTPARRVSVIADMARPIRSSTSAPSCASALDGARRLWYLAMRCCTARP